MHIIVCIKQVPNTNEVKIDPKTGTLIREGVESIINPDDRHALESALALKDQQGAEITVVTMGPPQADIALREALSMGCDRAVMLSDRAFAGADTWATSVTLASAINKIGDCYGKYHLILCGQQAIDGDTAQVGPQIAKHLGIPQATFASSLEMKNFAGAEGSIKVSRSLEDRKVVLEVKLPCVVTAMGELNTPRYPSAKGIFSSFKTTIPVWGIKDLNLTPESIGLNGSPTQVVKSFVPENNKNCTVLSGNIETAVAELIIELKKRQLVHK